VDQSLYTHWIVPIGLLLMAASFLAIGLRGLLSRHPFVVSGRWLVFCIGVWAAMQSWWMIRALLGGHLQQQWSSVLIGAIASGVLVAAGLYNVRGYLAYGVTTTSLEDGLRAALQALGLRNDVGFGGVYLTSSGAFVSVSMKTPSGVGRIRGDDLARPWMRDVVAGMNRHYAASNVAMNRSAGYLYTAAGLLMLGWVLYGILSR
jgi:hypothetical protein